MQMTKDSLIVSQITGIDLNFFMFFLKLAQNTQKLVFKDCKFKIKRTDAEAEEEKFENPRL